MNEYDLYVTIDDNVYFLYDLCWKIAAYVNDKLKPTYEILLGLVKVLELKQMTRKHPLTTPTIDTIGDKL